jgi:hypothetical protein
MVKRFALWLWLVTAWDQILVGFGLVWWSIAYISTLLVLLVMLVFVVWVLCFPCLHLWYLPVLDWLFILAGSLFCFYTFEVLLRLYICWRAVLVSSWSADFARCFCWRKQVVWLEVFSYGVLLCISHLMHINYYLFGCQILLHFNFLCLVLTL